MGMTTSHSARLKRLGIFTLKQAEALGIKQPSLSRLVQKGLIKRIRRGIYLHPEARVSAHAVEFQIACAKFGSKAAIGGLSALFHYNLVDQAPGQTWVIVPAEQRSYDRAYRLMRFKASLEVGILSKDGYRIASVERALIDALRLATKIGERTAIKAVRTAISQKLTSEAKLGKMAKELHQQSVLARYFEAITS